MLWIIFTFVIVIGVLVYKWATQHFNYFKDRGIVHGKPVVFFGTGKDLMLMKLSLPEYVEKWYKAFPDEKLVGLYDFRKPFFFIRDPELAKLICIKAFDHFTDHLYTINENIDPLLGSALISLSGKKWRDMRTTLSPAFTGSKMRQMQSLVTDAVSKSVETFEHQIKEDPEKGILEMKEFFSKFTVDIIASCAFGLEVDTFKNPENGFKKIADRTMHPNGILMIIKFILLSLVPKFMKKLDISLLERDTKSFFRQTVNETMNYREKNSIVRPDMIHLLMQTKQGNLSHDAVSDEKAIESLAAVEESELGKEKRTTLWTNDELVAQCLVFFLAGFDTTSTTLSFAAYELALNPDIQDKLRHEVQAVKDSLDDKELTYEALLKMKYLDQFVTEVLRKWPAAPGLERYCVKEFSFDLDGKTITIPKDHSVLIPNYAWHRDPKNFPDPEKFDPDRFNDENIINQNLNAYAPFGIGPRNCIGSRFALMSVKSVIFNMLLNFSFEVTEKTQIPLKYKKTMTNVAAENGTWVQLKALKQ